jgi:CheY-like chemotaxis protein/HPt (histidine-containing phosphotransfer) domain-containing protein
VTRKQSQEVMTQNLKHPSYPTAKILLTDDNELNRFVILEMLKDLDIKPDIAVNGKEAVDLCESKKFDLILMDIQMPVMDGIEATNLIHKQQGNNEIPIIGITADALLGQADYYIKQGLDDLITKPFHHKKLQKTLLKWIPHLEQQAIEKTQSISWKLQKICPNYINIEEGIKYANNKEEFYRHIVDLFYEDYIGFSERIRSYHQQKDWDKLLREVHSLKGLAKLIGAHKLNELSVSSNLKLKNRDADAYKLESYRDLENHLKEVLRELKTFLKT